MFSRSRLLNHREVVDMVFTAVVVVVLTDRCFYSSYLDILRYWWLWIEESSGDARKSDQYLYLIEHRRFILIRRFPIFPIDDVKRHYSSVVFGCLRAILPRHNIVICGSEKGCFTTNALRYKDCWIKKKVKNLIVKRSSTKFGIIHISSFN
jgi:hypothetical protein